MRFMAMAMVSWVSRLMAPRDMPPVQKRSIMAAALSTSSSATGAPSGVSSMQSRRNDAGLSLKCCWYAAYASCQTILFFKYYTLFQQRGKVRQQTSCM
jgi:hypothetical protein